MSACQEVPARTADFFAEFGGRTQTAGLSNRDVMSRLHGLDELVFAQRRRRPVTTEIPVTAPS